MATVLLWVHVAGGAAALAGALGAVMTQAFGVSHHWHVWTGLAFFWGMAVLFVTSIPLAILASSVFLLLVALFSFYMAWSGLRYAHRRDGSVSRADRVGAVGMTSVGVAMMGMGAWLMVAGGDMALVLLVFGVLAVSLGWMDLSSFKGGVAARGRARIAAHLRMMLGGTIAAITGFVTTNFPTAPALIAWLAPTVLLVPLLVWWGRRVESGGSMNLLS